MNYKLDEALLIVDAKGFPFREVQLRGDGVYGVCNPAAVSSVVTSHIRQKLVSNWVLYEPEDMVEMDFCLGELSRLISQAVRGYQQAIDNYSSTHQHKLVQLQKSLEEWLELLLQTLKRALFYEVNLQLQKMFKHPYSFCSLLLYCDNFRLLKIVTDIELTISTGLPLKNTNLLVEDHQLKRSLLTEVLIESEQFTGKLSQVIGSNKQWLPHRTIYNLENGTSRTIDMAQLSIRQQPIVALLKHFEQDNNVILTQSERVKYWLYINILRKHRDVEQMGSFIEMSKNLYMCKSHQSSNEGDFWQALYEESLVIVLNWKSYDTQVPPVLINQILLSGSTTGINLTSFLCSNENGLNTQQLLTCINFYYKNITEPNERKRLETFMYNQISNLIKEKRVLCYAEDIFEFIIYSSGGPIEELYRFYAHLLEEMLQSGKSCEDVNLFEFESGMMHFFKYFLMDTNAENNKQQPHFKRLITVKLLTLLRNKLFQETITNKQKRLVHFVFNQSLYFCLKLPNFEDHFIDILSDTGSFKLFVTIIKRLTQNNQIMFKMNFKFLHRIVNSIYSRGEETCLRYVEIVQLYWEIIAKFLLLWGNRSYLNQDTNQLRDHYDMILVKLIDMAPYLSKTQRQEQDQMKIYLQNKSKYNAYYVKCWLNFLSFKQKALQQHTLHMCVFIKDELPQNQFKNLLRFSLQMCTPLTICFSRVAGENVSSPSIEDFETLTSEFALESLECVYSYLQKLGDFDLSWSSTMSPLFWVRLWDNQRSHFFTAIIEDKGLTPDHYETLTKLRRLESHLQILNSVTAKLNEQSRKECQLIAQVETIAANVCFKIWKSLWLSISKDCVESFYIDSSKLKIIASNPLLSRHHHQLTLEVEQRLFPKNSTFLSFEKSQLLNKFLIMKLSKQLFNSIAQTNPTVFTTITKERIYLPKSINYVGKPIEYVIIGRCIELIRTIEEYFVCNNELQKKIKCSQFIPMKMSAIRSLTEIFTQLAQLIGLSSVKDAYTVKLGELLTYQIRKYFTGFLLHELLQVDADCDQQAFSEMMEIHMGLHLSMLAFMSAVTGFYEQTHPIYIEVLESHIKLLMTPSSVNQAKLECRKAYTSQFILSVFNMFLHSTFRLKTRVRSALFYQLISNYEKLTKTSKRCFNKAILYYLRLNFQAIMKFELTQEMLALVEGDIETVDRIKPNDIVSIPLIKTVCTQAMVINLLSRNNYQTLSLGIRCIFANSTGIVRYLQYLVKVSQQLLITPKLQETDMQTIMLDVFGSLQIILNEKFHYPHEQVFHLFIEIIQILSKVSHPMGEIRSNITKHLMNLLLARPSMEAMQKIEAIASTDENSILQVIRHEYYAIKQCRSHLHLLNCLYLERSSTIIRSNWPMVLQNFNEKSMEESVIELTSRAQQADFLVDLSHHSQIVSTLIEQFVECFETEVRQEQFTKQVSPQLYTTMRTLTGLIVKLPSLIKPALQHTIQSTNSLEQTFLDYLLQRVLAFNYQLVMQFIVGLLKTNGGFQITEDGILLSNNFILSHHIRNQMLRLINENHAISLLHYMNVTKVAQFMVKNTQKYLFGLYKTKDKLKFDPKIKAHQQQIYKSDNSKLLRVVLRAMESQPDSIQHLASLLYELLKIQLNEDNGQHIQENLVYFMNQELLQILRGDGIRQSLSFLQAESKEIRISSATIVHKTSKVHTKLYNSDTLQNTFINRNYSILKSQEKTAILKQSREICQKVCQLSQHNKLPRNLSLINERLFKAIVESTDEEAVADESKLTVPSFQEEVVEETNDASQERFFEQDEFLMPDEEDGIIDETIGQDDKAVGVSSFQQLHEQDCCVEQSTEQLIEPITSMSNLHQGRCSLSGNLMQSENGLQVVFKRVQKLELMRDAELGLDISGKIQFLSNDELLKMIAMSDGRLLLSLLAEKQKRGISHPKLNIKGDDDNVISYVDELYAGCRNNHYIQSLLNSGQTVMPQLIEESIVRIVNQYLCLENDRYTTATVSRVITLLCLNNHNVCVVAQLCIFVLSLKQRQAKLIEANIDRLGFPKVSRYSKKPNQLCCSLTIIKSRVLSLIVSMFNEKIGLPIWLYGVYSYRNIAVKNLSQVNILSSISSLLNQQSPLLDVHYHLIDIVLHSVITEKVGQDEGYLNYIQAYHEYVNLSEKKHIGEYPFYLVEELQCYHQFDVQRLANLLVRQNVRAIKGSFHNELLRLLLQVYPTCYEIFMSEFMKLIGEDIKIIVEDTLKEFKRFRLSYSLKPETCLQINKDSDKLEKLVDSYMYFSGEMDVVNEERLEFLRSLLTDICFDIVPWFKEWRFQVQHRVENYQFNVRAQQSRKRISLLQQENRLAQTEIAEEQFSRDQVEFLSLKSWKINEFLAEYLKPIHESISIGLLHSFIKAQELMEMMTSCFIPSPEKMDLVSPVYKKASNLWKAALAFSNLNMQEETNTCHTMASLQTRQALKSKNDFAPKSSNLNLANNKRRTSARLSIKTTNPFNIYKIVQKFLKHTDLMANFIDEGSRLTPILSKFGGLQIKLKALRRKKTGIVKEIEIDREKVWFDTILAIDSQFVNRDIRIKFKNQLGLDYGGLTKQWLTIITKELFNPMFGLFELSANKLTIQPSKMSHLVPSHLMHFRKLGVLVGKALVEGWNLEINFTRSFLKHLLGSTLYVEDLQDIDPQTCKSLMWILENQVDESLELTFSYESTILGERKIIPLVENGENILVNENNKKQYIKALCRAKMTDMIRPQSMAFMQGIESVIPYSILRNINYKELGVYLAGMPTINRNYLINLVAEMKEYAQYNNLSRSDKVVEWFWLTVYEFDTETLANFLFFLTGSFKVPYGGFKEHPIVLNKVSVKDHLPVAHTCFNTLDLPDYTDRKTLASRLRLSISEGRGFNVS